MSAKVSKVDKLLREQIEQLKARVAVLEARAPIQYHFHYGSPTYHPQTWPGPYTPPWYYNTGTTASGYVLTTETLTSANGNAVT